jgi:demethylmenaquinone methyltransferase/2-methoxy-6-polyprenyl-1,4-benzoquinol methylase
MMNYSQKDITPYSDGGKKSDRIGQMFDRIAPVYDQLNHILSWGIDKRWRRQAIVELKPFRPQRMMDAATGTGDFALAAYHGLCPELLIGTDISEGMMNVGIEKVNKEGLSDKICFKREDCTSLSFTDDYFDAVTVAFGIRNFEDLNKGLSEIYRVLKKDGHLVILELSTPDRFPMKQLYAVYSKTIIPYLGKILSKDAAAYVYLPHSVAAFPHGEVMRSIIARAGFSQTSFRQLTFGICTLYTATK